MYIINCTCIDIGIIPFHQQLQLFANTDILIGVGGTAIHNLLFMHAHTTLLLIMQPHWCEYAWMYANQAVLLDINYFIYCTPHPTYALGDGSDNLSDDYIYAHWTRKFGDQGSRMTKGSNMSVDVDNFYELFLSAINAR